MTIIRPFRGVRPIPERARDVASPPYDVLSRQEARDMAKDNPDSFLRVNKAEIDFEDQVNPYSQEVYQRGKANLMRLLDQGIMIRDEKPCLYLYRLTMDGRRQTGLVALTSVAEYDAGQIKKHEHTRPEKVEDRARHIDALNAQVGPVFCTFRHTVGITDLFAQIVSQPATTDFTAADGVRHELWVISESLVVEALVRAFGALDSIYIADGHHRSAASSAVARMRAEANPSHTGTEIYNSFLNVIFPDSDLRILAYNRVVKDLAGLTCDELCNRASEHFTVAPASQAIAPERPHQFSMFCDGRWFELKAKTGHFDAHHPTRSIDASILGDLLLHPVLGISDPKTDPRIDFVGGIRGTAELERLVHSGAYAVAFSLFPTTIDQLLNVADANMVMPPKSTWFEPKLRSGMVVNLLEA